MTEEEKAQFAVKLAHVFGRCIEHMHDPSFDVIVILRDPAGDGGKPVVGAVASRIDVVQEMLDQARGQLAHATARAEAEQEIDRHAEDEKKTSTKGGN